MEKEGVVSWDKTTSVSGVGGQPDRTLGEIVLPLVSSGQKISFRAEVLGGEGSLCPALVGNPSLQQLGTEYFENGDGLLTVGSRGQSDRCSGYC